MIGTSSNWVTTVLGFGMSSTFIIFVCVRLICARSRSDNVPPPPNPAGADHYEHSIRGVEPVVIAAIPTLHFKKESFTSEEDAQCAICLGEYRDSDVLRIMPNCGHNFHLICIDKWLRKRTTCPICRFSLINPHEGAKPSASAHQSVSRGESSTDQMILGSAIEV